MGLSQQEAKKLLESLCKDAKRILSAKELDIQELEELIKLMEAVQSRTEEKKKKKKVKGKKRKLSEVIEDDASTSSVAPPSE